jgi:RimJ/RimL family protein N-acetyltransferase
MARIKNHEFIMKDGTPFTISHAVVEDAEDVLHYLSTIFQESKYLVTTLDDFQMDAEREKQFIASLLDDNNKIMLVAKHNNQIIGTLDFSNGRKKKIQHTGAFGMSVKTEFRSKGVGHALLMTLLDWAEQNETIERVELEVFASNAPAIHLYKKLGFVEEGIKKNYIKWNNEYEDIILMAKLLK